jgi:L-alanine-DL-glutamate epimerase-like enolase superfamily enzyme
MRIRSIRAIPVAVPRLPHFLPKTAHGETDMSRYVLLQVETNEGIVGLGEVTCSPGWNGEDAIGTTRLVQDFIGPALVGIDASDTQTVLSAVSRITKGRPFLRAGIEMACLDAVGRRLNVAVATLLGGTVRQRIETKIVLPARDVERVAAMAQDLEQYAVGTVKVKVGTGIDDDIARVRRVREIVGEGVRITVDANEGWQPHEARRALPLLADLRVAAIEQPLARDAWQETAQLRALTGAALLADEAVWSVRDVVHAAQSGAYDAVSVYPGKCGGMRESLVMARVAGALNMSAAFGSNLELGVGAAALAHTIAACPELSEDVPSDLIGPLYFESSLVTDASFVAWDHAQCPAGPGLGVELDDDAVARYRTDGQD